MHRMLAYLSALRTDRRFQLFLIWTAPIRLPIGLMAGTYVIFQVLGASVVQHNLLAQVVLVGAMLLSAFVLLTGCHPMSRDEKRALAMPRSELRQAIRHPSWTQ
jgi:hypothetical protein